MKLLKLQLMNIASLKGSHVIDFAALTDDSQLFAITGPTGSGKSSILSSISLVLYGQTFKTNLNYEDFVTLGEADAEIILDFVMHGVTYRASWYCRTRQKSGKPLKMAKCTRSLLKKIPSTNKEENFEAVDLKVEDVLGLNFKQFTKTVILNQGEFAQFLTSSFTDRREILEKLYDGEALSILGKVLRSDIRELNQAHQNIHFEIQGNQEQLPQLSKEELEAQIQSSNDNISTALQRLETFSELSFLIKELVRQLDNIKRYQEQIPEQEKNLEQISLQVNHKKASLEKARSTLEELTLFFQSKEPLWRQYIQNQNVLSQIMRQQNQVKEELILWQKKLTQRLVDQEELNKRFAQTQKELDVFTQQHSSPLLEETIEKLEKELTQTRELMQQMSQEQTSQKHLSRSRQEHEKSLDAEESTYRTLQQKLSELPELDYLEDKLRQSNVLQQKKQQARENLTSLEKPIRRYSDEIQALEQQDSDLATTLRLIQDELKEKEELLKRSELLSSILICLKHADTNCPVCHSDLSPQRKNELLQEISTPDYKATQVDNSALQQKLEETTRNKEKIVTQLNLQRKLLLEKKEECQKTEEALKAFPAEIDADIKLQQNTLVTVQEFKTQARLHQSNIEKLKDKLLISAQHEEESLETLKKIKRKANQNYEAIKKELSDSFELAPFEEDFIPSLEIFLKKSRSYLNSKARQQQDQERISDNASLIQSFRDDIENNKAKEIKLLQEIDELKQKNQTLCPQGDAQAQINLHQKQIEEQRELQDLLQKKLHQEEIKLKGSQNALESLRTLIDETQSLFFQTCSKLKAPENENPLQGSINKLQKLKELEKEHPELIKELSSHLELEKKKAEDFRKMHQDLLVENKTLLTEFQKRESRLKELTSEGNKIKDQLATLSLLQDILGKEEFRNYALGLVEKQLIYYANQELSRLCDGRYELIHGKERSNESLDFYILDRFRDDIPRKVSTLSGGETFLTSLALALALSEMTRGKTEIESFFIDEGFGSLDPDAIEDALQILLKIQGRGKQIGIISHVINLTDRIPSNIRLTKSSMGDSQIKISYNY